MEGGEAVFCVFLGDGATRGWPSSVVTGRWTDGGIARAHRYCKKCMAYAVEMRYFMMECPAYQEIRANFQEVFDDFEGAMRKLMCRPKQHILAKLVQKMRECFQR